MNIQEVRKKGITKIRLNKWANPNAYIELYKDVRGYGPWATLHDDWGQIALGDEEFEKIKKILIWELEGGDWVEYNH